MLSPDLIIALNCQIIFFISSIFFFFFISLSCIFFFFFSFPSFTIFFFNYVFFLALVFSFDVFSLFDQFIFICIIPPIDSLHILKFCSFWAFRFFFHSFFPQDFFEFLWTRFVSKTLQNTLIGCHFCIFKFFSLSACNHENILFVYILCISQLINCAFSL